MRLKECGQHVTVEPPLLLLQSATFSALGLSGEMSTCGGSRQLSAELPHVVDAPRLSGLWGNAGCPIPETRAELCISGGSDSAEEAKHGIAALLPPKKDADPCQHCFPYHLCSTTTFQCHVA